MQVYEGYHECPRCKERDIYFAKRQFGQIGNLIDLPQGVTNPALSMGVEKDVALCRNCGERATWFPERVEYTPEEVVKNNARRRRSSYKAGGAGLLINGIFGIYGAKYGNDLESWFFWSVPCVVVGILLLAKGFRK